MNTHILPGPEVAGAEPPARSAVRALPRWPAHAEGQGPPRGWSRLSRLCACSPAHLLATAPHMADVELPEARPACPQVVEPRAVVSCSCLTPLVFPGQQQRRRQWARQQSPEQRPLLGGADSLCGRYPSCPGPQRGGLAALPGTLGCERGPSHALAEARCTQSLNCVGPQRWRAAAAIAERRCWEGLFPLTPVPALLSGIE